MLIEVRAVPPFMKNGFVLADETTREGVLIDPGDEVEELLAADRRAAARHPLHPADPRPPRSHHRRRPRPRGARACRSILHADDRPLYDAIVQQGIAFGFRLEPQPAPDRYFEPGDVFRFGRYEIRWHHTPGHSPGGVCLEVTEPGSARKTLIVGDTLFAGSIGRTDLPGGHHPTLIASIRNVLFPFGDDAVVHPGHGESTTIGEERRSNPFLV